MSQIIVSDSWKASGFYGEGALGEEKIQKIKKLKMKEFFLFIKASLTKKNLKKNV